MLSLFITFTLTTLALVHGQSNITLVRQDLLHRSQNYDQMVINGPFDVVLSDDATGGFLSGDSNPLLETETTALNQGLIVVNILDDHILSITNKSLFPDAHIPRLFIRYPPTALLHGIPRTQKNNTESTENGTLSLPPRPAKPIVSAQLNVSNFQLILSGSNQMELSGFVSEQTMFNLSGGAQVDASKLFSKRAIVLAQGMSNIKLVATDNIEIDAQGTSQVSYKVLSSQRPIKLVTNALAKILQLI